MLGRRENDSNEDADIFVDRGRLDDEKIQTPLNIRCSEMS